MSLKIVFMGTPEFAVASLERLIQENYKIAAVVTVPDKPAGRGQKIQYSQVKQFALDNNLQILQPEKLKDSQFIEQLKSYNADLFAVVAFRMLPEVVWSMPRLGTINLHASLLPQYRGAAPINWAIINGETETGVTTFLIEKEIDTGNILLNEKVNIGPSETAGDLHDRLMSVGADLLVKTIKNIESGNIKPVAQHKLLNHGGELKLAPKIFKENCRIDWNQQSFKIFNLIRGLSPFPAAWSVLQNIKNGQHLSVKLYGSELIAEKIGKQPGTIITDGKKYLHVITSDGLIAIKLIQSEGKKKLTIDEFLRGFHGIEEYIFVN